MLIPPALRNHTLTTFFKAFKRELLLTIYIVFFFFFFSRHTHSTLSTIQAMPKRSLDPAPVASKRQYRPRGRAAVSAASTNTTTQTTTTTSTRRAPQTLAARIHAIVKQLPSDTKPASTDHPSQSVSIGLVFSLTETSIIKSLSLATSTVTLTASDRVQGSVNRVVTLEARTPASIITAALHILVHLRSLNTDTPPASIPQDATYALELASGALLRGTLPTVAKELHRVLLESRSTASTAEKKPSWLLHVPLTGVRLDAGSGASAHNAALLAKSLPKFAAATSASASASV